MPKQPHDIVDAETSSRPGRFGAFPDYAVDTGQDHLTQSRVLVEFVWVCFTQTVGATVGEPMICIGARILLG